ncbi:MAG TPA: PH domain-containing protein [Actinomycetota bacterium]|nr:PH domain-containing protein [Actinomycetota bacterium]
MGSWRPDSTKRFIEIAHGLIPEDETIRAVVRALPLGEGFRRSSQANVTPSPTPMRLTGEAAAWPHYFARHASMPEAWSEDVHWFFWIVITDKHLHVFEGHFGKRWNTGETAGPESARFPLDRIHEIWFDERIGISQLSIWFEDGSSIDLDVGRQQFAAFLAAIKPFERPDSQRARPMGGMPDPWRWSLGGALVIGGMATSIGSSTEAGTARTILLVIGIAALALGAYAVSRAWAVGGWKRRRVVGIPLLLVGTIFAAAAFSDNCECRETIFFGLALAAIGAIAQVAPGKKSPTTAD